MDFFLIALLREILTNKDKALLIHQVDDNEEAIVESFFIHDGNIVKRDRFGEVKEFIPNKETEEQIEEFVENSEVLFYTGVCNITIVDKPLFSN